MILAYHQEDPYEIGGLSEYPGIVRPLIELESKVPGSWYINAISTYEEHRGKGVARALILDSEEYAKTCGCTLMSLIVTSENIRAKGLYEYLGFKVIDSQPVVPYPGGCHGGSWLLMTKDLETV